MRYVKDGWALLAAAQAPFATLHKPFVHCCTNAPCSAAIDFAINGIGWLCRHAYDKGRLWQLHSHPSYPVK